MNLDILKTFSWFTGLVLAQVFVLNHIHLFGMATPLLYVYFVLLFRRNYPQWVMMLWAFLMGLVIDTFSNTPGVASGSLTLMAAVQPFVFRSCIPRDRTDDLQPGIGTLGFGSYFSYAAIMTSLFSLVFFSLEMFSFFNLVEWVECVVGSSLITLVLLLVIDYVRGQR